MKKIILIIFAFLFTTQFLSAAVNNEIPASYKGRFRPFEAYSRLWLYDIYHRETIQKSDLGTFELTDKSAGNLLWKMHFLGHHRWNDAPLFWVRSAKIKSLLNLPPKQNRFSYNQLNHNGPIILQLMDELIPYYYFKNYMDPANRSHANKMELRQLTPGLWGALQEGKLIIAASPNTTPWNSLKPGMIIIENVASPEHYLSNSYRNLAEETTELLSSLQKYELISGSMSDTEQNYLKAASQLSEQGVQPKEIAVLLDTQYPLAQRLLDAGHELKVLPSASKDGEWYSIRAITAGVYDPVKNEVIPVPNFTRYSDATFKDLRYYYQQLEASFKAGDARNTELLINKISAILMRAYQEIAGNPYSQAHGKTLYYPSILQLKAESLYYQFPLIGICIALYAIAVVILTLGFPQKRKYLFKAGFTILCLALLVHTFILGLRCYILGRPPVSNMFETVIYVPWIAVIISIILAYIIRNELALIASSLLSLTLLVLLEITNLNSNLENVQAVLDSQYWLLIHVLMVVGSYGLFALASILGHIYLFNFIVKKKETAELRSLGRLILHSIYLGTALLIPGTILGGVWAAESWGRFWDWDPKESWAFISSCVYLMWIHAHRFNHIGNFGLAIGSILGFLVISFTWYGVNYILGTGLHSYGFGSGGEIYYYLFLLGEIAFIITAGILSRKRPKAFE